MIDKSFEKVLSSIPAQSCHIFNSFVLTNQIRLVLLAFFIYDYFLDYDFTKGFRLAVEGNTTNRNLETEDYRRAYWAGVVFLVLPLVIHIVLALYQTWRYLSVNAVWKEYEYDNNKCCFQTIVPRAYWCSWQYPIISNSLAAAIGNCQWHSFLAISSNE